MSLRPHADLDMMADSGVCHGQPAACTCSRFRSESGSGETCWRPAQVCADSSRCLFGGTCSPKSRTREDHWPCSLGIILSRICSVVFLRSYVVVARPIAGVEAEIAAGVGNWMPELARGANGDGEKLLSELGFNLGTDKDRNRRPDGDGRADVSADPVAICE
jgi:hypothetical protein